MAILVIIMVTIGSFGRGSAHIWPLLSWPMYHDRGETPPADRHTEVEVRALDSTGATIGTLTSSDVFGFERVPGGSAYLRATFALDESDEKSDRIEFLAKRANDLVDRDVAMLEAWRVSWIVDVGTVPPLDRDQPIEEERLGVYTRAGAPAP